MKNIDIDLIFNKKFDYILDARSPLEFEESHIPGAINFFVLNNKEREEVGSIYKNISKTKAKKIALPYILKNISKHIPNHDIPAGSKVLVYCARGGKRSSALQTILSELDIMIYKLNNGYKAYRQWVINYLSTFPHNKFIVLGGNSGCGKSELIEQLPCSIDLEKLANHYGSVFGDKGKQPSQKQFENNLSSSLMSLNPNTPIFIEAESRRIGKIYLPNTLYQKMQNGLNIEITSPIEDRVNRILGYYGDITHKNFQENLDKIKKFISNKIYNQLQILYSNGDLKKVAKILLQEYYDKVYKKREASLQIDTKNIKKALSQLQQIQNNFDSFYQQKNLEKD